MFKKKENNLFIGYYTPSVFVTYLGVISSCIGIYYAFNGLTTSAIICLIISGICDGFDGKIARACKRTNEEKLFGIQIDSLADMNSFIFLPVIIAYSLGLKDWYHIIIYTLFTLGGIIRLGYFNIIAEESGKDKGVAKYHGLPVTSTSIILPLAYALKNFINSTAFTTFYTTIMAFTALLFILNFTFKKPQTKWLYVFVVFSIIMISYFILGTK